MGIPNNAIKKMVRARSNVMISNSAASAIAKLLERRAKTIAKYAVKRAKAKGRSTVLGEDVDYYRMKFGD